MSIIRDPNGKKSRKNPFALNGTKLRPIAREMLSAERDARNVFIAANAGKLSKGRNESRNRFGGASAGRGGASLGGGVYEPNAAPHNPGNIGTI